MGFCEYALRPVWSWPEKRLTFHMYTDARKSRYTAGTGLYPPASLAPCQAGDPDETMR